MSSALQSADMARHLAKRYRAERRFRLVGLAAISLSLLFLAFLLFTIIRDGIGGLDWSFLNEIGRAHV